MRGVSKWNCGGLANFPSKRSLSVCLTTDFRVGLFNQSRIWLSPKLKSMGAGSKTKKSKVSPSSAATFPDSVPEIRRASATEGSETQSPSNDSPFSLFCRVSTSLQREFERIVPVSANIHVYVALNASSVAGELVPTVFIRKGMDTFCSHVMSSPLAIVRSDQCDEFVSLSLSRIREWLSSQRVPVADPERGFPSHSHAKLVTEDSANDWLELPELVGMTSANHSNVSADCYPTQPSSQMSEKSRRGVRVHLTSEGLQSAGTSDLITQLHKGSARAVSQPGRSDSDDVPTASAVSPLVSHLEPSVINILNGRYPSNLFYFRGENLQSIQNKRGSVLYKQVRHLQQALGSTESTGFISIKILPWCQYYRYFSQNELLRGHTMEAMFANESGRWTSLGFQKFKENTIKMIDITKATPHHMDPDAFFISVELFTHDVMEAGQLARNALYPPLHLPKPEALSRSSILPEGEGAKEAARICCSDDGPNPAVSIVDSTRMWASTNKRFFVRFADAEHGPLGVLREMLGHLIEAFDIGTSQLFSEEGHLCRKLDSNLHNHQPKNFSEIISRHFLGQTVNVDTAFMPTQSSYAANIKLPLSGNYYLDHEGNPLQGEANGGKLDWEPSVSSWEQQFNGRRTPEECLLDLSLGNIFSPLSGFPPITIGRGVGKSKKDAVDPGLLMHIRRNFYREVGVAEERSARSLSSTASESRTQMVLSSRLHGLFAYGSPSILSVKDGCAASRFSRVSISDEQKVDNTNYLTDFWRPLLEALFGQEQCLKGHTNVIDSLPPASIRGSTEEDAVQSLREALARNERFKGFGFSLHSTVSKAPIPDSSIIVMNTDEGPTDWTCRSVWYSEVVVNNQERTVLGSANALKKRLSKHEAVLAALHTLSPEMALRLREERNPTYVSHTEEPSVEGPSTSDTLGESFAGGLEDISEADDLMSDALLDKDETLSFSDASVTAGEDGWSAPCERKHVYHPAVSALSQYRRALQMQIELVVDAASDSLRTDPVDQEHEKALTPYWFSLQPLKSIFEVAHRSGPSVEFVVKEVIDERTANDTSTPYKCTVYAERCDLAPEDGRIVLAESQFFSSPALARLNALATAFHFLVCDHSLSDETIDRIGDGVLPRFSLSAPSLVALGDVCLLYLGQRASVMRAGTSTNGGNEVTYVRVIIPSTPNDTRSEFCTTVAAHSWTLAAASHGDASNAERIAILTSLKALMEASQPSGSIPRLRNTLKPQICSPIPPPTIFTIAIGVAARGFMAKALSLLLSEAHQMKLFADSVNLHKATIVMRGFADPARLRILWDDSMLGYPTQNAGGPSPRRHIKVLEDTINALHTCVVTHSASLTELSSVVASEAASDVQNTLSITSSITASLHLYDPDTRHERAEGGINTTPILPLALASSGPCTGVLAAVDGLVSSLIHRLGEEYMITGGDMEGRLAFCELLKRKVLSLRVGCLHTTDTRPAALSVSEMQETFESHSDDAGLTTALSIPPVVLASKSVLGSRRDFNKAKHLKFENYLERFVLMVFGKSMDVFYSRPSAGVRSAQRSSYESNTTHIEPLESNSSVKRPVIHNWYCVLGVEIFGEDERSLLSEGVLCASDVWKNVQHSIQNRLVSSHEDEYSTTGELLAIGSLEPPLKDRFLSISSRLPSSPRFGFFTTDTDSIRRGFGGTIKDVRPGFLVVGFGSGETKKDAHAAAAQHALRWHFPEQMQELQRRGVRW